MTRGWRLTVAVALLLAGLVARPATADPGDGRPYLLVVSGLGGEPYYADLFHGWSLNLLEIAHQRYGIPDVDTLYLAASPERDPQRIDGPATRQALLDALADLARRSAAGDRVLLVLVGHGTAQGAVARFNLPGPDLAPETLAEALGRLAGRRVAVINTAPASGAFVRHLAAPERVVITATADGSESQHTRFAGFFIDALASDEADTDKDRAVSLLEAFRFAQHRVARAYKDDRRLQTEHALLDDDGDGDGSREPQPDRDGLPVDGTVAARFTLAGSPAAAADGDPLRAAARLALQLEARRLVEGIERLKRDQRTLTESDYTDRLEALLVELALNRRAYRRELAP